MSTEQRQPLRRAGCPASIPLLNQIAWARSPPQIGECVAPRDIQKRFAALNETAPRLLDISHLDTHTSTRSAAPSTCIIEECRELTQLGAPRLLTMYRRLSRCWRGSRSGGGGTRTRRPSPTLRSPSR